MGKWQEMLARFHKSLQRVFSPSWPYLAHEGHSWVLNRKSLGGGDSQNRAEPPSSESWGPWHWWKTARWKKAMGLGPIRPAWEGPSQPATASVPTVCLGPSVSQGAPPSPVVCSSPFCCWCVQPEKHSDLSPFPTCYCRLETLAIFRFLTNSSRRKSGVNIKISYQKND